MSVSGKIWDYFFLVRNRLIIWIYRKVLSRLDLIPLKVNSIMTGHLLQTMCKNKTKKVLCYWTQSSTITYKMMSEIPIRILLIGDTWCFTRKRVWEIDQGPETRGLAPVFHQAWYCHTLDLCGTIHTSGWVIHCQVWFLSPQNTACLEGLPAMKKRGCQSWTQVVYCSHRRPCGQEGQSFLLTRFPAFALSVPSLDNSVGALEV